MFSIFFREPFLPPCWLREIFQVSWRISYLYRQWPVFLYECQFTMFYFWPFLMISFFINPDKSCFASLQHLYMYKKFYFLIFKYLFYYFLPISFLTQKIFLSLLFYWIFLILHYWLFKKCFFLNIVFAIAPFVPFLDFATFKKTKRSEILRSWSLQNTLWKQFTFLSSLMNFFSTS